MLKRGTWSSEEDRRLIELVETTRPLKWVHVAASMGTRTSKQCRERYHNYLNPNLSRKPISHEEGKRIEELVRLHGKKWAEISRHLPGRSDNAIKNWWNAGPQRRRASTSLSDLSSPSQLPPSKIPHRSSPKLSQAPTQVPRTLPIPGSNSQATSSISSSSQHPQYNYDMGTNAPRALRQPQGFQPGPGSYNSALRYRDIGSVQGNAERHQDLSTLATVSGSVTGAPGAIGTAPSNMPEVSGNITSNQSEMASQGSELPPPVQVVFNVTYSEPQPPVTSAIPRTSPVPSPRNSVCFGNTLPLPVPSNSSNGSGSIFQDDHLPDPTQGLPTWSNRGSISDWFVRRSSVESVHTDLSQYSLTATTSPNSRRGSAAGFFGSSIGPSTGPSDGMRLKPPPTTTTQPNQVRRVSIASLMDEIMPRS